MGKKGGLLILKLMLHCINEFRMEVFVVFVLNLMSWFQEWVKLLVAAFLEQLNVFVLEHKASLKNSLKGL